jgi:hypothetical protein
VQVATRLLGHQLSTPRDGLWRAATGTLFDPNYEPIAAATAELRAQRSAGRRRPEA